MKISQVEQSDPVGLGHRARSSAAHSPRGQVLPLRAGEQRGLWRRREKGRERRGEKSTAGTRVGGHRDTRKLESTRQKKSVR